MAWRFDANTDKVLVGSGWTGSSATMLLWFRRQADRNAGSNPWRAWSNAAGGGSTVAGIGSDGGGDNIVSFDSAFSNLTGPTMDGTWRCLALVMSGTAWTLYYGTDPTSLSNATGTKANATSPGSWTLSDDPDFLSGDLAGVKLFGRALSGAECAAELATDAQVSATNLVWRGSLRTTSNTPETGTAMTAGSTAITLVNGPAYLDRVAATSTTTTATTAAAVAWTPPLAAYSFDSTSGSILDDSGNSHSFALANGLIRSVSGHTNGGVATNGGGEATLAATPFGQTSTRTVMCWIKNPPNATNWVVRWDVVSINSGAWGILFLNTQVVCQARNAGGFVRAAATRPTDGLWHHYAATYDGTSVRFYLDATLTDTQAITAPLRTDADTIKLGDWTDTSVIVDDLRMFDSALTVGAISALAATPVAVGGVTGAVTSTTTTAVTAAARLAGVVTSTTSTAVTAAAVVTGAATSTTTTATTAAARLAGVVTSTSTTATTAAARLAGAVTSTTTTAVTAAARAVGVVTSTTTTSVSASASAAGVTASITSTTVTATTAAARLAGAATSSTSTSVTAAARLVGVVVAVTTTTTTAVARASGVVHSTTVTTTVAVARSGTAPPGPYRAGVPVLALGWHSGATPVLAPSWAAGAASSP